MLSSGIYEWELEELTRSIEKSMYEGDFILVDGKFCLG